LKDDSDDDDDDDDDVATWQHPHQAATGSQLRKILANVAAIVAQKNPPSRYRMTSQK